MSSPTPMLGERERAAAVAASRGMRPPVTHLPASLKSTTPMPKPSTASLPSQPERQPDNLGELLARAESSHHHRTRNLAARIRQLVADLRVAVAAERKLLDAETRVERLARQLQEAKDELKAMRTAKAPAVEPSANEPVDSRAVRAWAAANNVECPSAGRVPRHVIEAWRAGGAS